MFSRLGAIALVPLKGKKVCPHPLIWEGQQGHNIVIQMANKAI